MGKCTMTVIAVLALAAAFPVIATTTTDTLYPTDDTYTPDDTGGSSHGSETQLLVANFEGSQKYDRSMLLFDLAPYAGVTINLATFHVYQFFHCPTGTPTPTDFFHATEEWDESWDGGYVDHGTEVWANTTYTSTLGYYDTDITDLVQGWVDGDMPNYGFVMQSQPGGKYGKFYSKDNSDNKPYLELEYSSTTVEAVSLGAVKAVFK
jgi:hypothetical protein